MAHSLIVAENRPLTADIPKSAFGANMYPNIEVEDMDFNSFKEEPLLMRNSGTEDSNQALNGTDETYGTEESTKNVAINVSQR